MRPAATAHPAVTAKAVAVARTGAANAPTTKVVANAATTGVAARRARLRRATPVVAGRKADVVRVAVSRAADARALPAATANAARNGGRRQH